jgi:hypothetical protein
MNLAQRGDNRDGRLTLRCGGSMTCDDGPETMASRPLASVQMNLLKSERRPCWRQEVRDAITTVLHSSSTVRPWSRRIDAVTTALHSTPSI